MAAPFNLEDLAKLKSFVEFVGANPAILNMPQLEFFKKLIEQFGGKVPEGTFQMPAGAKCPFGGDVKSESKCTPPPASADEDEEEIPEMEAESEESEVELDMEANDSQPFIEPIQYLEEKPLKVFERLEASRRVRAAKKGVKKKTISKSKRNRVSEKHLQLNQNIKLELDYGLHKNEECERMVTNDPLFTPQVEIKCDATDDEFYPNAADEEESEVYFDSDDDKDYCFEDNDDDDEQFKIDKKRKVYNVRNIETKTDEIKLLEGDDDDDDEPLISYTKMSSGKCYKKTKTPRLKDCPPTCRHKCTSKYERKQRLDIFHFYWQLNQENKVKFLRKHIRKPVSKHIRSKNIRNNCCYFLKYYKIEENSDPNQTIFTDDDEDITKVCRIFFNGTLKISDREIKEAVKDYELKPERIVRPVRDTKNENLSKSMDKESQPPKQYLDPETGDLTDSKPKRRSKPRRRGEPQPEKFPKPINCAIRCKFKCHEKFNEVERKQICDIFWSLDFKRRKDFILSRIETTDVKTPITPEFRKTDRPTRAYQAKFYLRSGLKSENIRVCKHFLVNTLCINRWFIENAIEFADKITGAYTGMDRRGTHSSHYKISDDRKQVVLNHINSYPYWIPNKKSKTKYLHHSLTIKKMYEAYKEKCEGQNIEYVTLHYYYKLFHAHFHVLFLANPSPKKGGGFLKANPNISHFTGDEPGGYWIDSEGTKLDSRSINPALTLDDNQQRSLFSVSQTSFVPNPFIPGSAACALNLVQNPLKTLANQHPSPTTSENLSTDSVNMFKML